jgi:SARP family transcriptional regulator, regulator of embCAB operon
MEIGVLGPFFFRVNGRDAAPGAPRVREMLALFSLRVNHIVLLHELVRELWGEDPPQSAKITLQTYIVRLRQKLAETLQREGIKHSPKDLLGTRHGGYQLTVERDSLDFLGFEDLVAKGRRELAAGDHVSASALLRSALALWRGPVLVDVRAGSLLDTHIARLTATRLTAAEQLMESELRQGNHLDILGDLMELAAEHPFHENLHAQLMVALYRSSRRFQALEVFGRLRNTLAEDLGLDPSPQLQRLHQALLGGDPVLDDLAHGKGLLLDRFAA